MRTFFSRDMFSLGCFLVLSRLAAASSSWSTPTQGAAFAPTSRHTLKTTTTRSQHRGVCRSAPHLHTNPILEMLADAASGKRERNNGLGGGVIESVQDFVPPHSALAQVVANQYGIDLRSVSPSPNHNGPGGKITVEDVEYHAWKISQPPCTPEVLEWAHSLGLDLNDLYDDEDRRYVMNSRDVQLYEENVRSLKISSQTRKKTVACDSDAARRRTKKMSALDERMERNMKKLSERTGRNMYKLSKRTKWLAGTVTGSILQRVQQAAARQSAEVLKENVPLVDTMNREVLCDTNTLEGVDANVGSQTIEALSSFNLDDNNTEDVPVEAAEEENSPSYMNGEDSGETKTVEDVDADLGSQITDASSSVDIDDNNTKDFPVEVEEEEESSPSSGSTREELQTMTCVELKERLRGRGMKVSGKKAELIDRLLDGSNGNVPAA